MSSLGVDFACIFKATLSTTNCVFYLNQPNNNLWNLILFQCIQFLYIQGRSFCCVLGETKDSQTTTPINFALNGKVMVETTL